MTIKLTIMGSGNSAGTPTVGNYWGNCDPNNPKNRRNRASVVVQSDTTTIVIDSGPDFRQQVNDFNVEKVDAVFYTHGHGDHINGIDDLRVYRYRAKQLIDAYGLKPCLDEIQRRFEYLFVQKAKIYPQVLNPVPFSEKQLGTEMQIGDIRFIPFVQDHGTTESLGFRFGNVAYSTDMVGLNTDAKNVLQGVEHWIADGSGYKMEKNIVHATLRELYLLSDEITAKNVYLTHLTPSMDYDTVLKETPDHYYPAYDGLSFEITYA